MGVFAVIVTYNGLKWLETCLDSLLTSTMPCTIIVVDNGSTDGIIEAIERDYSQVVLIKSECNLGFGKANNLGIKYAMNNDADYVLLLNQDAWIDTLVLEDLIKIHKSNPNYGILSPIHLNGKGTALDANFALVCSPATCPGLLSDLYVANVSNLYKIHFVMAAIWLLPKEVIMKVGLFDPLFPHYGEDVDYVQRTRFFGYKIGICPNLRGYHDREERSSSEIRDRKIRYLGYLSILKDINKSFISANLQFLFLWIRHLFKFLFGLYLVKFLNELLLGFKVLILIPKIISRRHQSKLPGAFDD